MDASQLDLTGFPKITPQADEKTTIEQQSKSIETIKAATENLLNLISVYVNDLTSFDSKIALLNKRDAELKLAEYDVAQKEKKVYEVQAANDSEKLYIIKANKLIKEREEKIAKDKDYTEDIKAATKEFEERKAEALAAETAAEEKAKLVIEITNRENAVKTREEFAIEKEAKLETRDIEQGIKDTQLKAKEEELISGKLLELEPRIEAEIKKRLDKKIEELEAQSKLTLATKLEELKKSFVSQQQDIDIKMEVAKQNIAETEVNKNKTIELENKEKELKEKEASILAENITMLSPQIELEVKRRLDIAISKIKSNFAEQEKQITTTLKLANEKLSTAKKLAAQVEVAKTLVDLQEKQRKEELDKKEQQIKASEERDIIRKRELYKKEVTDKKPPQRLG